MRGEEKLQRRLFLLLALRIPFSFIAHGLVIFPLISGLVAGCSCTACCCVVNDVREVPQDFLWSVEETCLVLLSRWWMTVCFRSLTESVRRGTWEQWEVFKLVLFWPFQAGGIWPHTEWKQQVSFLTQQVCLPGCIGPFIFSQKRDCFLLNFLGNIDKPI